MRGGRSAIARHRLALGTMTLVGAGEQPPGAATPYDITGEYTVRVDGLPDTNIYIAVKQPTATEIRTVIFHAGAHGTLWYGKADPSPNPVEDWVDADIKTAGVRVVMVRWHDGWDNLRALLLRAGPARCAARVATVVKFIHDTYCATVDELAMVGNSAGSSALGYCLFHYGQGKIIKRGVFGSGPPHAALLKGGRGDLGLNYNDPTTEDEADNATAIDDAYGYSSTAPGGPATRNALGEDPGWYADGVDTGATYLSVPNTLLTMIFGSDDTTVAPAHAVDLIDAVGPANIALRYVTGAGHSIQGSQVARAIIRNALVAATLDPGMRQASAVTSATGTTFTATFPRRTKPGTLLLAPFRIATPLADIPVPAGWTRAPAAGLDFSGTRSLHCFQRVADGTETGITVTSATSAAGALAVLEVDGLTNPILDVSYNHVNGAAATSITLGATGATTAAVEFAFALIGVSGGSFNNTWTNGFARAVYLNSNLTTATKTLSATGAITTAEGFNSSVGAAGIILTFKSS